MILSLSGRSLRERNTGELNCEMEPGAASVSFSGRKYCIVRAYNIKYLIGEDLKVLLTWDFVSLCIYTDIRKTTVDVE